MARRTPTPEAKRATPLTPLRQMCDQGGNRVWVASHGRRTGMPLEGLWQLGVGICQCHTPPAPFSVVGFLRDLFGSRFILAVRVGAGVEPYKYRFLGKKGKKKRQAAVLC